MTYWSSAVASDLGKADVNVPWDISINCSSFINQTLCAAADDGRKCGWVTGPWVLVDMLSGTSFLATRDAGQPATDTCAWTALYFPSPRYIPFWHLPFVTAASIAAGWVLTKYVGGPAQRSLSGSDSVPVRPAEPIQPRSE